MIGKYVNIFDNALNKNFPQNHIVLKSVREGISAKKNPVNKNFEKFQIKINKINK